MRIAVVSQYYPPEPGATQNRLGTFAEGLAGMGHEVTVVCEQPNHPAGVFHDGYGRRPVMTDRTGPLTVHRLWVAASPRKTTLRRIAFYSTFAAGAASTLARLPRQDVVFATSPPMPGALAAAAAARARRIPFVLDVRDLWPGAAEALGELSNERILHALERAERWLYRTSARVTATTRPFCRHIDEVAGSQVSFHLPNGALDELIALGREAGPPPRGDGFVVGYVGNLGIAQGLGVLLDAADRLRGDDVRFRVVGSGPLAAELPAEAARRGLTNVAFEPPVPVQEVGRVLLDCHALLVPLRAHQMLEDFIPSKLYDAMAVGRPALVATRGEAAALASESGAGIVVPPEDGDALAEAIRTLRSEPGLAERMAAAGQAEASKHARSRQVERLERLLGEAAAGRPSS